MRTAIADHFGAEADAAEDVVYPLGGEAFLILVPDGETFAHDVFDFAAGVERGDRVLEDHLHSGAHSPHLFA